MTVYIIVNRFSLFIKPPKMKNIRLLSGLLFITVTATHLSAQVNVQTVYDQLVFVNHEWTKQPDADPALKLEQSLPLSEQELVQQHLSAVEKLLRKRDVSQMPASLRASRLKNLDVLHQYLTVGSFPLNTMHQNRQPYFIDEYNTFCAVGYLLKESGYENVARDIQRTQNFSYLADIHHEKLMGWVQQSGLTFDELALIQPGYDMDVPAAVVEFHYNNTGPDQHEYIEIIQGGGLYARFNTVLFYNSSGTLYKTLTLAGMQSYITSYHQFYYYEFPIGESFEDEGRIELWGTTFGGPLQLISSTTYNSSAVSLTDYVTFPSTLVRNYPIGESEFTPLNISLEYCNSYLNASWNLTAMAHTRGAFNYCILLPVTLGFFNLVTEDGKVKLDWQTESESNSKEFIIERSLNGTDFSAIGTVPAAGNSTSTRYYTFKDRMPGYINHYRIKMKDLDGKETNSRILYVKVNEVSALQLEQNIVNNQLRFRVTNGNTVARLEVYNMSGHLLYTAGAVSTGIHQLDITNWPAGKYIIRLLTREGQLYNQQFIKQ